MPTTTRRTTRPKTPSRKPGMIFVDVLLRGRDEIHAEFACAPSDARNVRVATAAVPSCLRPAVIAAARLIRAGRGKWRWRLPRVVDSTGTGMLYMRVA